MPSYSHPVIYTSRMRAFDAWFSDGDIAQRKDRYEGARLTPDEDDAGFVSNAAQVVGALDDPRQFDDGLMDHLGAHWLPGADSWFSDSNARSVLSCAFTEIFRIGAATGLRLNTVLQPADVDEVTVSLIRGADTLTVAITIPDANVPTAQQPDAAALTWLKTDALWDLGQPAVVHFSSRTVEDDLPPEALIDTY